VSKSSTTESLVESMLEEWKRGMLSFWVLGLLLQKPMYGLEIKKEILSSTQGRMKLGDSTIYQLLHRLESRGLVSCLWKNSPGTPPRAYYEITPIGREVLLRYTDEVLSPSSPISAAINDLASKIFQK
jgi:PadR family transcriptional regulator PadR